jgi:Co/Zn/Cd efflux system component
VDGGHVDDDMHEKEKQRNVNLHAAYLHVLGDLAQSVAVLLGGTVRIQICPAIWNNIHASFHIY